MKYHAKKGVNLVTGNSDCSPPQSLIPPQVLSPTACGMVNFIFHISIFYKKKGQLALAENQHQLVNSVDEFLIPRGFCRSDIQLNTRENSAKNTTLQLSILLKFSRRVPETPRVGYFLKSRRGGSARKGYLFKLRVYKKVRISRD